LCLERATIADRQGASEDQKFVAKSTQLNMNLFFANSISMFRLKRRIFMILIVNTPADNPYQTSLSYQKKSTAKEVNYLGKIYDKQINYEKQISLCCRIIRAALCLLGAITLIPLCVSTSLINKWWNQAISGIDQKIVLIKNQAQPSKKVSPPDTSPFETPKPFRKPSDVRKELFQKESDTPTNQAFTPVPPIKDRKKNQVQFRDVRVRLFDPKEAPAKVADVASVNLTNLE
jgi:hypothetical protein